MSRTIKLKDKEFSLYIPEKEIVAAITRVAGEIKRDMEGKEPLFVGLLTGAYMFVAELLCKISPECEITFVAYRSYSGTKSDGIVQEILPLQVYRQNRTVILLEDIVDSGLTMQYVTNKLHASGIRDVRLATMLFKPNSLKCDIRLDYVGMEIDDEFVVGFGLDYDGLGRSLRDIYKITNY
ncbi:MAG: hypoxanthine phosphoribosyltransferase [Tannerella sp.]|jgi:hypoxanthine phosphoribosyltransferase|nr:hypoxanthine phosphoribosyltransferase [Tannerella sp.]